jgi:hypothetical protein
VGWRENLFGREVSLSVVDKVRLSIAIVDLAGLILWIGLYLHLAYTKMDLWPRLSVTPDNLGHFLFRY